jgi:ABC-2 type transport system permease protein
MITRITAIIRKEIYHILRDPRTLMVLFVMPTMMVLIFGYALNMDVAHIPIAVNDLDHTPESRALIRSFTGSDYFAVTRTVTNAAQVGDLFRVRLVKAALVIPRGFAKDLNASTHPTVQVIIDGSDPAFGNAVLNYADAVITTHSTNLPSGIRVTPAEIRENFLFNPDLKSSSFVTPGLVAVILMMACALLTSITLAREKETGTLDILVVSPISPGEIVIGKVIPYVGLALINSTFVLSFAKIVFDIPLRGDLVLLLGMGIIYIYCALGIGLFISSVAKTQQVAMIAALASTIMPSVLLSGFIFPVFSMPAPIRVLTYIVPARHFLEIIRGILLKSSTFDVLKGQAAILLALGTVFLFLASVRFKTRVN